MIASALSLALLAAALPALCAPTINQESGLFIRATPPPASDDPNDSFLSLFQSGTPEPIRGTTGATVLGPQNIPLDRENPDFLAPPSTDTGSVANAKWPFSLSHNRIQEGGWGRQQTVNDLPAATRIAGVNMRLKAGAIRELHWHTAAEWAYMISGSARITAINQDGQNYIADVNPGDLWYFPAGIPHSIQGLNDVNEDGCEFLLVFDNGDFSEDSTFLLTEWLAHVPKEVLAKNFQMDISAFDHIPSEQLWIFPSAVPPSLEEDQSSAVSLYGNVPEPFTFPASKVNATAVEGGSVKVIDSRTFTVSKTIAVAELTIEVGGMRELHWHPTEPEWSYFLEGNARMTLYAASGNARTFNYQAGDVGYVPPSYGHYIENIGNTTLRVLEIFNSAKYEDISLAQWLALTPPELVKAHLALSDETISRFNKTKALIV